VILPGLLFIGYQEGGFFPRVKWPEYEVNLSPSFSAEVKNEWRYTSTPPTRLYAVDKEKFTFTELRLKIIVA
jgi:hypothetical protein